VADRIADLMLGAYRLGTRTLRPAVPFIISARTARGKEDPARSGERYGKPSLKRPEGRLIWVHAASVGETNAVLPLVNRLTRAGFPVLFTTTTVTSAEIAKTRLPEGAMHQFGPLDIPAYVERFLDHWRPYMVVFVESELWPNTIARLEEAVVPFVLVNGRMSDRSFRRWQQFGPMARSMLSRIGLILARSAEDARRFRVLGGGRVEVTGDLKFDAPPPEADGAELARMKTCVADRPVWVAASTHEGEETVVAAAHRILRANMPGLLTIIVPRHPNRGDSIRAAVAAEGLSPAQRSRGELPNSATDVYVADTLGEMGLIFRLVLVSFIGGSIVRHGGHNPIEAVRLDCAVIHGAHVHNFADLYALIDGLAPDSVVADAEGLAAAAGRLLADPVLASARAQKAAAALSPLSGALDATMLALKPYLSGKFYAP
jgi:3-deoxy-D-manno-octulosonic-acid transferase